MVEEQGMDGCKIPEIESKRPVFSVFKLLAVKVKGCVRGADALFPCLPGACSCIESLRLTL